MKKNFKYFLLRLLPYVISIIIGVSILTFVRKTENFEDETISDLLINIASDLLSIPFVFICYEVVSKIINRDLNNTLFKSTTFDINSAILNIVNDMRILIGYNNVIQSENLEDFLRLTEDDVAAKLLLKDTLNNDTLTKLSKDKDNLSNIIHKDSTIEVLNTQQLKNLLYLLREMDIIFNKLSMILGKTIDVKEKLSIASNFENIINSINNWLENFETDALIKHQQVNQLI